MDDNRVSEIKKEDKKAFKGFLVITILSGIAGATFSNISGNLKEVIGPNLSSLLMNTLEQIVPFASIVISIIAIIASIIIYTNSRKGYELWKEKNEDDSTIDKIEQNLSYLLLAISINMILGFFFMGAGLKLLVFNNVNSDIDSIKVLLLFIGFLLCQVSCIIIQKKVVNLEKEINPLLKGSIYDAKFSEKWFDSCDESIKLSIYKSSYKSFKSVSTTCIILWLFSIIGFELWDFGIMPLVMVTIIWLVLTVSYCIEAIKHSKI
ncbi:DUF3169 family protein [Romboutsia weinsteinii]|uniref:DUF3169 family protein n=1 Tax=Romboutsia weinsteinii TaxID=2020949 RepID=A0A371J4Z7_9FIRM|nr:DUF3169 family protein [Romboutsia weinsteinii]RDY27852.1 DUF3169 family protein [Romboutsia weinsteinii]